MTESGRGSFSDRQRQKPVLNVNVVPSKLLMGVSHGYNRSKDKNKTEFVRKGCHDAL